MKLNISRVHDEEARIQPQTEPKIGIGQQIDKLLLRALMEGTRITDLHIQITKEEWERFKALHEQGGWKDNAAYEPPNVNLPKTNAVM